MKDNNQYHQFVNFSPVDVNKTEQILFYNAPQQM